MEQVAGRITFGEIMSGATSAARRFAMPLAAYVVGLSVLSTALQMVVGERGGSLIDNIATFVAGFFLLRHMLRETGLLAPGHVGGGFGAYFGVSLLSNIACALGFVLLIVPGLILAARWSIAALIAIAEDQSATGAMRASWDATRASQWQIVLAYIVYFLLLLIAGAMVGGAAVATTLGGGGVDEQTLNSVGIAFFANLVVTPVAAFGTLISLSILQGLYRGTAQLEDVFA